MLTLSITGSARSFSGPTQDIMLSLFAAHTWHLPNHIDLIIEFDTDESPNDGAMEREVGRGSNRAHR